MLSVLTVACDLVSFVPGAYFLHQGRLVFGVCTILSTISSLAMKGLKSSFDYKETPLAYNLKVVRRVCDLASIFNLMYMQFQRRAFWLGDILASLVFCHITYGGRLSTSRLLGPIGVFSVRKDLLFGKNPTEQALKQIFYSFNRACFGGVIAEYLIRIEH